LAKSYWEEDYQVYKSANGTNCRETKVDSQLLEADKHLEETPYRTSEIRMVLEVLEFP
jgi:hypothetical protein